jgi:molybdopterin/thiamine biosynthesis adenylyltransferase
VALDQSAAFIYLAASGIGTIGVVDFDRVEASNFVASLNHVIHAEAKLGVNKAESAVQ